MLSKEEILQKVEVKKRKKREEDAKQTLWLDAFIAGICPNCGSEDISTSSGFFTGKLIYQCRSCTSVAQYLSMY